MGTLEFSVKGLAEELRRRRDARRGPALLTVLLIASLLVLTHSRSPEGSGTTPEPEPPRDELDAVPAEDATPIEDPDSDNGSDPAPQAAAQISPAQRNFGSRAVGDSAAYRFTLTNNGTLRFAPKIALNPANANTFSLKEQCATLEPKQSCTIDIAFAPRAAGNYSARLVVRDEHGQELAMAKLSGAGEPESVAFTATPTSLIFPPQQIGTNSATQTVVLRNARARQFFAGYDTASGTADTHFGILNCRFVRFDKQGTPGDSCPINVSFHPTTIGPQKEVLEVREMSAPGVPKGNVILARITLEGSGTLAALRISPRLLDFSDPNGSPQRIVIENVGTAAVTINGAPITGSDSNRFTANVNACRAQPIAPNSQCVITVAHLASTQQANNAELEVSHSAASVPDKVRLTWTAPQMPQFSVSPTSLDLGSAQVGGLTRLLMTLTNVGAVPANSVVMVFTSGDRPSFAITDDSCSGRPLAPQGRCTAILLLRPQRSGSLSTNLVISDSNLRGMTTFSVTGQATPAAPPIG